MKPPLVITKFWVQQAENTQDALSYLKAKLESLPELPESITIVSAGEVKPFLNQQVMSFYRSLSEIVKIRFVSAACVSLHGAILDFYHTGQEHGLVLSLEISLDLQQSCLDSLGVGLGPNQDGLRVVRGVGLLELRRGISLKGLVVEDCQIFSQAKGLSGTTSFINELARNLKRLEADVRPVSFSIHSHWARSIFRGLEPHFGNDAFQTWLPSVENSEKHYLSLKPIYEIKKYYDYFKKFRLLFFTLGGGGRLGWLLLSSRQDKESLLPEPNVREHSFNEDLECYRQAIMFCKSDKAIYLKRVRETLKYPRACYRGLDNHYFCWQFN